MVDGGLSSVARSLASVLAAVSSISHVLSDYSVPRCQRSVLATSSHQILQAPKIILRAHASILLDFQLRRQSGVLVNVVSMKRYESVKV